MHRHEMPDARTREDGTYPPREFCRLELVDYLPPRFCEPDTIFIPGVSRMSPGDRLEIRAADPRQIFYSLT